MEGGSVSCIISPTALMVQNSNEETSSNTENAQFGAIFTEIEQIKLQLEAREKELENREKELQFREARSEADRKNLCRYKALYQSASEEVLMLSEELERSKEVADRELTEIENRVCRKLTGIETRIGRKLTDMVNIMGVKTDRAIESVVKKLKRKEEELNDMKAVNKHLILKESKIRDELDDARDALVSCLKKETTGSIIGLKRMGELDEKPFCTAMKRKFSGDEAEEKALELCLLWEDYLKDPCWNPFKIRVDKKGNCTEIIDRENEKLKNLENEFGDDSEELIMAVTTAFKEMNEYNPSDRHPVAELWNFRENRKATLKEGVLRILKQCNCKRNRT